MIKFLQCKVEKESPVGRGWSLVQYEMFAYELGLFSQPAQPVAFLPLHT